MRRMIIACDGTGQSASREIKPTTNVIRFCHALYTNFSPSFDYRVLSQQLIFYQSGIGTAASGFVHDAYAEGTGLGIDDNILDAYTFIMNNYIEGDELYIFGYSRGAFTARVLTGLIIQLGIFKTKYLSDFKKAFKAYRTSETAWKEYLDNFHKELEASGSEKPPRTQKAIIRIVGCWDTVGSVGLPVVQPVVGWLYGSSGVYDPSLMGDDSSRCFAKVENAFHALALDECRRPFSPTLWYLPKDSTTHLEQCWFTGAHGNVGGGYGDTGLSDMALAWMIDRCSSHLTFDEKELDGIYFLHRNPRPRKELTLDAKEKYDESYQGWSKGLLQDSYWGSPRAVQSQGWRYRRPMEYGEKEGGEGKSVRTSETIHASVRTRWNARLQLNPQWKPESLSRFVPRAKTSGEWEWIREEKPVSRFASLLGSRKSQEIVIPEAAMSKNGFEARLKNAS